MVRGYYGWQPANAMEERRFERELAKRTAELEGRGSAPGQMVSDAGKVVFPWMKLESPDDPERPA